MPIPVSTEVESEHEPVKYINECVVRMRESGLTDAEITHLMMRLRTTPDPKFLRVLGMTNCILERAKILNTMEQASTNGTIARMLALTQFGGYNSQDDDE